MLILTFEEFNNKFNINNKAMSDIRIKDIGRDISLTIIEIVMRDQSPKLIREPASQICEPNVNIVLSLHPTDGTQWVLVIRREGGPVYYFDSFGVETPPLFLEEYVDLGSNERIQQYDESYCGAYCLYMIYLIDRRFRINNVLNILVNQCKYPGVHNECFCLGCSKDLRSSFANNDNVNDNVNNNDNFNDNVNVKDNDNVTDNVNDNDNDNNNVNDNVIDNFLYLFDKKHQRGKPNNKENLRTDSICGKPNGFTDLLSSYADPRSRNFVDLSNNISVNINEDLHSWLNDDNIITEATIPENF